MSDNLQYFYAVAVSSKLTKPKIYKNWKSAYPYCIDKKTGKPFHGAKFKKFITEEDAINFIKKHVDIKINEIQVQSEVDNQQHTHSDNITSISTIDKKKKLSTSDKSYAQSNEAITESSIDKLNLHTNKNSIIEIYTDGACIGNGKSNAAAGYGVYFGDNDRRNVYGPLPHSNHKPSNQRAELTAILKALEVVKNDKANVRIHSDSIYSMKSLKLWLPKWKENNYKTASKSSVKNLDLILEIDNLIKNREDYTVEFVFVRGHSGNAGNEAADKLARKGANMY